MKARALWRSDDGKTYLLRHCAGVYTIEHEGVEVMPPSGYQRVWEYLRAEFFPLPEPE